MLTDPVEIAIIAKAKQANVRDPNRSRAHFEHIYADFLDGLDLRGQRLLDIGPGQFDFGELVRARGASVVGADRDPAVLELGRHKGYEVIHLDFRDARSTSLRGPYDGVFCKYSLNAFWFHDDLDGLRAHIRVFLDALRPNGWGWIAPWNGVPKQVDISQGRITGVLRRQRDVFAEGGFSFVDLTEQQTRRYGVHGRTADNALFTRGLPQRRTIDSVA